MKYKIYTSVLVSDAYGSFNNAVKDDLIKERMLHEGKLFFQKDSFRVEKPI